MSKRTLAILAAIGATFIYGINHTVAKGVMPTHVKPFGFIFLRVGGAALLFWLIFFFWPQGKNREKRLGPHVGLYPIGYVHKHAFVF